MAAGIPSAGSRTSSHKALNPPGADVAEAPVPVSGGAGGEPTANVTLASRSPSHSTETVIAPSDEPVFSVTEALPSAPVVTFVGLTVAPAPGCEDTVAVHATPASGDPDASSTAIGMTTSSPAFGDGSEVVTVTLPFGVPYPAMAPESGAIARIPDINSNTVRLITKTILLRLTGSITSLLTAMVHALLTSGTTR